MPSECDIPQFRVFFLIFVVSKLRYGAKYTSVEGLTPTCPPTCPVQAYLLPRSGGRPGPSSCFRPHTPYGKPRKPLSSHHSPRPASSVPIGAVGPMLVGSLPTTTPRRLSFSCTQHRSPVVGMPRDTACKQPTRTAFTPFSLCLKTSCCCATLWVACPRAVALRLGLFIPRV